MLPNRSRMAANLHPGTRSYYSIGTTQSLHNRYLYTAMLTHHPIGIFDSGYGGLTVFRAIRDLLPQYDYLYLGDKCSCALWQPLVRDHPSVHLGGRAVVLQARLSAGDIGLQYRICKGFAQHSAKRFTGIS